MFSHRLPWDLAPNRVTELLRKKREAGESILDLTESNPTAAGLMYPASEILTALRDPRSLVYQPSPAGLPETRRAVAQMLGVESERVLITASTSESYSYIFKALVDPGDEVLAPRPSYPLFEFLAALDSVEVRHYSLVHYHGWFIDFDSMRRAITPRTRAVILVHPNNPTGSFVKRDELAELIELCLRHGLAIISDEVFADYRFAENEALVPTLAEAAEVPVFTLGGLSKLVGLPQMKLGWIVLGGPEMLRRQAAARIEFVADTYLSVGAPIQHATPELLRMRGAFQDQLMKRLRHNLDLLRRRAAGSHCSVLDIEGGWYATVAMPRTRTEEEWAIALLQQDGVLVQPGYFYDFESEAFLVLSLLTQEAVFGSGAERLLARAAQG